MKILLLAAAFTASIAFPAVACRATVEYPQVVALVAKADLPAAQRQEYEKKLEDAQSLHHRGHEKDDAALRRESLEILDGIKAKLAN